MYVFALHVILVNVPNITSGFVYFHTRPYVLSISSGKKANRIIRTICDGRQSCCVCIGVVDVGTALL